MVAAVPGAFSVLEAIASNRERNWYSIPGAALLMYSHSFSIFVIPATPFQEQYPYKGKYLFQHSGLFIQHKKNFPPVILICHTFSPFQIL
jgi:hypothetical protein